MKIIFVTTESFIDHSYTMIQELKKFVKLSVIIIAKQENGEILNFCKRTGSLFFLRTKFINPMGIFRTLKLLRKIKTQDADLVWFNTMSVLQLLLVRFYFRNFILNVHDVSTHPGFKDFHGLVAQKLTYAFYKKKICVMSKSQSQVFEQRFGISPPVFQLPIINYYSENKIETLPAKVPDNKLTTFLFFGSVLPYKGIELLLDAAEILENKKIKFKVIIYGKLLYNQEELKNRINKLKSVELTDRYIEYTGVNDIYLSCNVVILPYRHVSQCGPLLIAYNEKIPVICNDIPGFREYVDVSLSGLLFDGSPKDLSEKMNLTINNENLLMSFKDYIKNEMQKKFSMKQLVRNYILNFKNSLQNHS